MSKNYKIAVLPGDGTGPEVIAEAIKVLDAAGKKFGFSTEKKYFDWGGEHYLKTGETLRPTRRNSCRSMTRSCSARSATRT